VKTLLLACACLLLAGCGLLSPDQQKTALDVIDQMVIVGSATPAQAAAMREAVLGGGQMAFWQQIGLTIAGAVTAYAGVQMRRGPITQRVGLPESLIRHPAPVPPATV